MRGRSSLPAPTNITTGSISPGNSNSNMELEHPKSEGKRLYFGADVAELAPKMVKGARLYTEGNLRVDAWEQDGKQRSGPFDTSWHCRIAAIGRNSPKRERKPNDKPSAAGPRRNDFHNDEIGFGGRRA